MSEENKIPNDSQEEKTEKISGNEAKITIKKSTYNKMLMAIVAAIAIAAFFGGYSIGTFDDSDSDLTGEQLKEILSEIKTAPTPQPTQQSPQPSAPQTFTVSFDGEPVRSESESSNVPMVIPPKKAAIPTAATIAINILLYVDFFIVIFASFPLIFSVFSSRESLGILFSSDISDLKIKAGPIYTLQFYI